MNNMKKKLENIVPDIYKALAPLAKGNGLELSDQNGRRVWRGYERSSYEVGQRNNPRLKMICVCLT